MVDCLSDTVIHECLDYGSLVLLHRFEDFKTRLDKFIYWQYYGPGLGVSVGVKAEDYEHVEAFYANGCRIFVVDIAHGGLESCLDMCRYIRGISQKILLIAGNVVTYTTALGLLESGVDLVKVGVGGSGVCTTRLSTGFGRGNITALEACYQAKRDYATSRTGQGRHTGLIADGGLKYPGDFTKALVYADLCMTGSWFARTRAANNGGKYRGSSTLKPGFVEGREVAIDNTMTIKEVYNTITDGVRSGLSYAGCYNTKELKGRTELFETINPAEIHR